MKLVKLPNGDWVLPARIRVPPGEPRLKSYQCVVEVWSADGKLEEIGCESRERAERLADNLAGQANGD